MVILIGKIGCFGGMYISWPFACVYTAVPYLVDYSWPAQGQ